MSALLIIYLAVGLTLSVIAALIAARRAPARGRGPVIWGALGFFFGIFALIALFRLPPVERDQPPCN